MVMRVDRAPVGLSRTAQLEELPYSQSQRGRGNPVLSLCSIFPFLFLCLLVICLFLFFSSFSSRSRALSCSLMKNGLSPGHLSALCDRGPHLLHATSNTVEQAGSSTCAYLSYGNVLLPFSYDFSF